MQVLAEKYKDKYKESIKRKKHIVDDKTIVPNEFLFNPGDNLKLFPPNASYYKDYTKKKQNIILFHAFKNNSNYILGQLNKTGNFWITNKEHQLIDYKKQTANILIKQGYNLIFIKDNHPNLKNFDAIILKDKEIFTAELKKAISYNAVQNRIKQAKLQKAQIIVFYIKEIEINEAGY